MLRNLYIALIPIIISISHTASAQTLCNVISAYQQPAGVEYEADESTMSADIGAPLKPVYDVIRIPLTIDFAEYIAQDLPDGFQSEGEVGYMEIHQNGDVLYNGANLTRNVEAYCGGGGASAPSSTVIKSSVMIDGKPVGASPSASVQTPSAAPSVTVDAEQPAAAKIPAPQQPADSDVIYGASN